MLDIFSKVHCYEAFTFIKSFSSTVISCWSFLCEIIKSIFQNKIYKIPKQLIILQKPFNIRPHPGDKGTLLFSVTESPRDQKNSRTIKPTRFQTFKFWKMAYNLKNKFNVMHIYLYTYIHK